MIKKISIIIVVLYSVTIFVTAANAIYYPLVTVAQVVSTQLVRHGATKYVPALLRGSTVTGTFTGQFVKVKLIPATQALLNSILMHSSILTASLVGTTYMQSKGAFVGDVNVGYAVQKSTGTSICTPNGTILSQYKTGVTAGSAPGYTGTCTPMGFYSSSAAAYTAANALAATAACRGVPAGTPVVSQYAATGITGLMYVYVNCRSGGTPNMILGKPYLYYFWQTQQNCTNQFDYNPYTENAIEVDLTNAIIADLPSADAHVDRVIQEVATSLEDPNHPANIRNAPAIAADLQDAIKSGITQDQVDNVEATATDPEDDQTWKQTDQEVAAAQMVNALREALQNAGLTSTQIAQKISDIQGKNLTAAQTQAAVKAALQEQNLSAAQIATALGQNLTSAQTQAAVTASLTAQGLSSTQIATAIKNEIGSNLTEAQTKAAVKAALQEQELSAAQIAAAMGEGEGGITQEEVEGAIANERDAANAAAAAEELADQPVLDTDKEDPAKRDFTPLINTWFTYFKSLPVLSFLDDLKDISASGSCSIDLDLLNGITGSTETKTVSLCSFQNTFQFMGSILLLITAVIWLRWLFE